MPRYLLRGHRTAASFRRELLSAVLHVAVAYRTAHAQFERHRRRAGLDHRCDLLFDQMSLSQTLLFALTDELSAELNEQRSK
jgi:ABC-type uncharacterized transport system YnjBCD ATPase subunit